MHGQSRAIKLLLNNTDCVADNFDGIRKSNLNYFFKMLIISILYDVRVDEK